MKHLRKTISLFLSVILVLSVFSLVPFDVIAAEFDSAPKGNIIDSGTTGDCWWRVYEIRHYNSKKEYTYSERALSAAAEIWKALVFPKGLPKSEIKPFPIAVIYRLFTYTTVPHLSEQKPFTVAVSYRSLTYTTLSRI